VIKALGTTGGKNFATDGGMPAKVGVMGCYWTADSMSCTQLCTNSRFLP